MMWGLRKFLRGYGADFRGP
jgi:hypothetical protein